MFSNFLSSSLFCCMVTPEGYSSNAFIVVSLVLIASDNFLKWLKEQEKVQITKQPQTSCSRLVYSPSVCSLMMIMSMSVCLGKNILNEASVYDKTQCCSKRNTPGLKAWNASTVYNIGKQVHLCPEKKNWKKTCLNYNCFKYLRDTWLRVT